MSLRGLLCRPRQSHPLGLRLLRFARNDTHHFRRYGPLACPTCFAHSALPYSAIICFVSIGPVPDHTIPGFYALKASLCDRQNSQSIVNADKVSLARAQCPTCGNGCQEAHACFSSRHATKKCLTNDIKNGTMMERYLGKFHRRVFLIFHDFEGIGPTLRNT